MSEELGENKNCTCNQRQSHKWNGNECVISPPGMSLEEIRRLQEQYNQAAWNSLIANSVCKSCSALQVRIREKDARFEKAQLLLRKAMLRLGPGMEGEDEDFRLEVLEFFSKDQQAQSEKSE